ncbi:MAG TPA: fibronectin type III-like domain-contianing protein, partial [Candidatus Blautia faecavium]|nr:fibronectin type III-like domain-contianing protein [Candidatus Blautia faecavium]
EGAEVVQLYMHDAAASLVRPKKELKGFQKIFLKPGERKEVSIYLEKSQMGFYDDDMRYHLEDGEFILYMGGNSRDCISETTDVKFQ